MMVSPIQVGDVIIAVNGSDMKSMSHKTATRLLSIAGSSVRLTVKRFVGKVHIMLVRELSGPVSSQDIWRRRSILRGG